MTINLAIGPVVSPIAGILILIGTAGGTGTVSRFRLADELGQPAVPTRGDYALRLVTGPRANDAATSS